MTADQSNAAIMDNDGGAVVTLLKSPKAIEAEHVEEMKPWVQARYGTYHHRPRTAHRYPANTRFGDRTDRLSVTAWCGQLLNHPIVHDEDPVDHICGTCEGRFLGWQREQRMIFRPEDGWALPRMCPFTEPGRGETCPVCGGQGRNRWYGASATDHEAGPGLAAWAPCPHHGWTRLTTMHGTVICTGHGDCGYELETRASGLDIVPPEGPHGGSTGGAS